MPKQSIDKIYSFSSSPSSGSIFISNIQAASNILTLKKHNIQAIVTVAKGSKLSYSNTQLPDYLYIPAQDTSDFNLTLYFPQSNSFIEKCLEKTNVLVHCVAGISRSATLVVAYLMKRLGKEAGEVIRMVQAKREIVNPNSGFKLQLRFYESTLKQERMRGRRSWAGQRGKEEGQGGDVMMTEQVTRRKSEKERVENKQQDKGEKIEEQNKLPVKPPSFFHYRPTSYSSRRQSSRKLNISDIFNNKGESVERFGRINLKQQSSRKCYQKMVLNNSKRVEERLASILGIND